MISLGAQNINKTASLGKRAGASIVLDTNYFINITGNNVIKAGATGIVSGVNVSKRGDGVAFPAAKMITFIPQDSDHEYEVDSSASLTTTAVGKYFNITAAANVVDAATVSSTVGQLQMTRFISPTKQWYKIVNRA